METDIDPSEEYLKKGGTLRNMTAAGSLPSAVAKLSGSLRGIPSQKDFYFYANFDKFKTPIKEIDGKSKTLLEKIGTSSQFWGKSMPYPESLDYDDLDLCDWLVNVNDDMLEKVDASLDEFRNVRKKEEEGSCVKLDTDSENGFHVVCGKKNRKGGVSKNNNEKEAQEVQVATKVKPKIPFHIASIPRPQDEYKIIVNNSNQPFEHVWLQRSEDGSRFIHPLETLSVMDFVDKSITNAVQAEPLPLECTPFKLVEDVKDLKQLAAKLRTVDEFAVDLEHNQYRSFQGLTCLMQISTRTEDFVIDTLKLRIHIGPYLREVFKDPSKRKVMHGADRDILWLQRDFGIYVCNMFDTGQASRVLKMDRHSLEYLLFYFCGVIANKEYQNADWRLRPLPDEMLRYAREDTHYLLSIYDMMRRELLSASAGSENSDALLVEVYKRSYHICMQLYEKELLTDSSYLHIYGLQGAGLNAQQLAVVAGLYEWRDVVARAEDESTGYVVPNKTLIEIAKQMPLMTSKLRRVVKSKHPYIERNLGSIVGIIRHSIQNSAAFEVAAEQLKQRLIERASENTSAAECAESLPSQAPETVAKTTDAEKDDINFADNDGVPGHCLSSLHCKEKLDSLIVGGAGNCQKKFPEYAYGKGSIKSKTDSYCALNSRTACCEPDHLRETGASVQVLKKPTRAFGALLGSSSMKKLHPDKKELEDLKLEQIKSAVNLGFHSFVVNNESQQLAVVEPPTKPNDLNHAETRAEISNVEGIISIESGSHVESRNGGVEAGSDIEENQKGNSGRSALEMEEGDNPMSLSDLSSSFQKCFQSTGKSDPVKKPHSCEARVQLKPFDYESAKDIIFGEDPGGKAGASFEDSSRNRVQEGSKRKGAVIGGTSQAEAEAGGGTREFAPGRRRQAFPASGNRSSTFR